jgi:hypothetical protein
VNKELNYNNVHFRVYHPYEPDYLAALKKARVKELKSRAFAKDFATYLLFLLAIAIISQVCAMKSAKAIKLKFCV